MFITKIPSFLRDYDQATYDFFYKFLNLYLGNHLVLNKCFFISMKPQAFTDQCRPIKSVSLDLTLTK